MLKYFRQSDSGAPLAKSLRRLTFAVVAIVAVLGVATALLATRIKTQVDQLNTVNELDVARDAFYAAHNVGRLDRSVQANEPAMAHLNEMEALLTRFETLDPGNAWAIVAVRDVRAGRRLKLEAARAGQSAMTHIADLRATMLEISRYATDWIRLAVTDQREATQTARMAEVEQRRLNDALIQLSAATLVAAGMKRDLDAFARISNRDPDRPVPLDRRTLSTEGLPPVCDPSETVDRPLLCTPSTARIRTSIQSLLSSPPDALRGRVERAQMAVDAYTRAGERRFLELQGDLDTALDSAAAARQASSRAGDLVAGLTRLKHAIRQTEELLDSLVTGAQNDLARAEPLFRGLLGQIEIRTKGTANVLGVARDTAPDLDTAFTRMRADWALASEALSQRYDTAGLLTTTLSRVDDSLARLEADTRSAAAVFVGLVSSAALLAAVLLGLLCVALLWGGQTFVARPLARTTRAILELSRGENTEPVTLGQRSLGLGELEDALESLRLTTIEREELTQETIAQRRQIERNLQSLAEKTDEMEHLARHDALTGLPNRRFADDILGQFQAVEVGHRPDFTLLHVDVDRFKEINDTLGHEAGDAVLCHVAALLSDLCEEGDMAFRIGGDEFLVLRRASAPALSARQLAENIIDAWNQPIDYRGHACRIGASIGIAHGRDVDHCGPTALVNADIALYEAKTSGRNRYVEFSPELQAETVNRKTMSDRLLMAIENDEFVPHYQPQFFSDTLALRGLETLCRWHHPEHGILSPAHFMQQAEASTLVGKIDQMLLQKSAADLAWLQAQGHIIPKISFNVTADRLMHADFAETLVREIGAGTKIAIELLESMSLDSLSESVRWAIDTLQEHGVSIEIDDFGSCRASIAGLIAVGPDAMKIDGDIVSPITTSPQHLRLVRAIIDIGDALGIEVIAERVETADHIRILKEQGCSVLQGYALAKPMPIDELAAFLTEREEPRRQSA